MNKGRKAEMHLFHNSPRKKELHLIGYSNRDLTLQSWAQHNCPDPSANLPPDETYNLPTGRIQGEKQGKESTGRGGPSGEEGTPVARKTNHTDSSVLPTNVLAIENGWQALESKLMKYSVNLQMRLFLKVTAILILEHFLPASFGLAPMSLAPSCLGELYGVSKMTLALLSNSFSWNYLTVLLVGFS
jgi:hypothetical protein